MSEQRIFTDEEITGYLDGELDAALATEIRTALANDAELGARLARLSVDTMNVKTAFDGLLADAPSAPDFLSASRRSPSRLSTSTLGALAATALFCFVAGGFAGSYLSGNRADTWRDFAATYHALYVNATLSKASPTQATATAELARVSQALGKKIELKVVSDISQLDYKRAQILGFEGHPLVQIAFLSKVGAPVALCIMRSTNREDGPLKRSTMRGLKAVSWSRDNYEYLLIGGSDAELLDQAAASLANRL